MKNLFVLSVFMFFSQIASADGFNLASSGDLRLPELEQNYEDIKNIVTEKFKKRYPNDKWSITIYTGSAFGKNNGGVLGFASVGVAPRGSKGYQPATRVWHFVGYDESVINPNMESRKILAGDLMKTALKRMMEDCQKHPNCDIDK